MSFKLAIASFLLFVLTVIPTISFAEHDPEVDHIFNSILTTIGVGTVLVGGTTALIAGGIYTTTSRDQPATPQQVLYFLKENKSDFRASVQLGSGEVLIDFSRLLGFDDERTKALAQLLRTNRKFVNEKALNKPTEENVIVLLAWIHQKMS